MLMFIIVAVSMMWMHGAIVRMERRRIPELAEEAYRYLPEIQEAAERGKAESGGNARTPGERAHGGQVHGSRA
jgi:NNP family nitrate/nitrite transporter-like MFS transporter